MKTNIRLNEKSLDKVKEAFKKIDEVAEILDSAHGNEWGDLKTLGVVWSDLNEIIELHEEKA